MKQVLQWVPLLVLGVALAADASAQRPGFGPGASAGLGAGPAWAAGGQGAAPLTALKDALGLTDQQVQQLTEMRKRVAESNQSLAEQIRAKRQQLADLLKSANPDPAKIGQLHLEIHKLNEQRLANIEQFRAQALTVLTAEQKQKLAELEKALALAPAARQAAALGLISPPRGQGGLGAGLRPGMRGMRPGRAGGGWI